MPCVYTPFPSRVAGCKLAQRAQKGSLFNPKEDAVPLTPGQVTATSQGGFAALLLKVHWGSLFTLGIEKFAQLHGICLLGLLALYPVREPWGASHGVGGSQALPTSKGSQWETNCHLRLFPI